MLLYLTDSKRDGTVRPRYGPRYGPGYTTACAAQGCCGLVHFCLPETVSSLSIAGPPSPRRNESGNRNPENCRVFDLDPCLSCRVPSRLVSQGFTIDGEWDDDDYKEQLIFVQGEMRVLVF